tara:strand:- start:771 stop:1238 length:468 start_codon:yes stop_codon:yes gene_type:complete
MDVHVLFISGMDEQDTNAYFEKEGWENMPVYKDQINKQTKLINKKNPIRVTIWTMLITPIIQDLIQTIEAHIKYVVFLYHAHKPITLMRCIGFHEKIKEYNMLAIVLSSHSMKPLNKKEFKIISGLLLNMTDVDYKEFPHYSLKLNSILKLFINI